MVLGGAFTRLREMVQDPSLSFYDRECIEMVLEVGKKNYEELEQLRGRVIGLEYQVKRLTGENHDLQVLVGERNKGGGDEITLDKPGELWYKGKSSSRTNCVNNRTTPNKTTTNRRDKNPCVNSFR